MKVLIPILSENDGPEFIKEASESAKEIVLLLVIDAAPNQRFGFTTSQISRAQKAIQDAKKLIGKKKKIEEVEEWGDTPTKIRNTALLKNVKKIVMKTQHNQLFETLVDKLRREKFEVELL